MHGLRILCGTDRGSRQKEEERKRGRYFSQGTSLHVLVPELADQQSNRKLFEVVDALADKDRVVGYVKQN